MPNWCVNRLKVTGRPADLRQFQARAEQVPYWFKKNEDKKYEGMDSATAAASRLADNLKVEAEPTSKLTFSAFVQDTEHKKDESYDCDWCRVNWGTKWDAKEASRRELKSGGLVYDFDTAWCPPEQAIAAMSAQYPTLTFDMRYWEHGCEFQGRYRVCKNKPDKFIDENKPYHGDKGG